MTKYEQLKEEIAAIAEIANSAPEAFRERCFDILLQNLLAQQPAGQSPTAEHQGNPAGAQVSKPLTTEGGKPFTTPASIKVFMSKTGVTLGELARVVMFEDGVVHFIQEPEGQAISRGQIEWALLLALKNGMERNLVEVDPESVRSICQEKGFYDSPNFQRIFKNSAHFFQGAMERQGAAQKLTNEGLNELGKIVKELAAKAAATT